MLEGLDGILPTSVLDSLSEPVDLGVDQEADRNHDQRHGYRHEGDSAAHEDDGVDGDHGDHEDRDGVEPDEHHHNPVPNLVSPHDLGELHQWRDHRLDRFVTKLTVLQCSSSLERTID